MLDLDSDRCLKPGREFLFIVPHADWSLKYALGPLMAHGGRMDPVLMQATVDSLWDGLQPREIASATLSG